MAWTDLTQAQQEDVKEFFRDYRAAIGDIVRSLRTQDLLTDIYDQNVSPVWATIASDDIIPDGNGLANSGTMTKSDWTAILTWSNNLLGAVYSTGGDSSYAWPDSDDVDQYGTLAAGPSNI